MKKPIIPKEHLFEGIILSKWVLNLRVKHKNSCSHNNRGDIGTMTLIGFDEIHRLTHKHWKELSPPTQHTFSSILEVFKTFWGKKELEGTKKAMPLIELLSAFLELYKINGDWCAFNQNIEVIELLEWHLLCTKKVYLEIEWGY